MVSCIFVSYIFGQLYFWIVIFWSVIFLVSYIFGRLYFCQLYFCQLYFWSVIFWSVIFLVSYIVSVRFSPAHHFFKGVLTFNEDCFKWNILYLLFYFVICLVTEMLVNILNICSDDELMSDSEDQNETEGRSWDFYFFFELKPLRKISWTWKFFLSL